MKLASLPRETLLRLVQMDERAAVLARAADADEGRPAEARDLLNGRRNAWKMARARWQLKWS